MLLQATVGTDGTVTATKVLWAEPSGLTEAANEALKQWRYEPARNAAGKPVAVILTVTFRFALTRHWSRAAGGGCRGGGDREGVYLSPLPFVSIDRKGGRQ